MKRVGEPPKAGIRYQRRPGAYAILPVECGLLLTLQTGSDEALQLPGGGIDPGESPLTALHREVFEETGWHISRPRRIGAFRRFVFMPDYQIWAEKVCTIYLGYPTLQLGPPTEPHHVARITSIPDALDGLGNVGDRTILRQAMDAGLLT